MEYKPGRLNFVADALLRQPDFKPTTRVHSETFPTIASLSVSVPSLPLLDDVRKAYAEEKYLLRLMDHLANPSRKSLSDLPALYRSYLDRYKTRNDLLYYTAVANDMPRVVVPDHDDFCLRIMFEYHYATTGEHRGREKT